MLFGRSLRIRCGSIGRDYRITPYRIEHRLICIHGLHSDTTQGSLKILWLMCGTLSFLTPYYGHGLCHNEARRRCPLTPMYYARKSARICLRSRCRRNYNRRPRRLSLRCKGTLRRTSPLSKRRSRTPATSSRLIRGPFPSRSCSMSDSSMARHKRRLPQRSLSRWNGRRIAWARLSAWIPPSSSAG